MLSFPSQNDIIFSTGRVYSKKQTRVTVNQHIFKSGLIAKMFFFVWEIDVRSEFKNFSNIQKLLVNGQKESSGGHL